MVTTKIAQRWSYRRVPIGSTDIYPALRVLVRWTFTPPHPPPLSVVGFRGRNPIAFTFCHSYLRPVTSNNDNCVAPDTRHLARLFMS